MKKTSLSNEVLFKRVRLKMMWDAWLASSVGWANASSAQHSAQSWADEALAQPTN
jgi:hypothetical protein